MDRNLQGDEYTDSFVEIKLGEYQNRTQTCRKTLNPVWSEDFKFEVVDDSILQNTPVELKVMDQDLYSSEQIGGVFVDLNPLIMRTANVISDKDLVIDGWFPIYDTVRGVHGSLKVIVKLQFIGDDNPFRESSAGVQFFSSSYISSNLFIIQDVLGFVADLVVEDDPELSWHDYFRMAKSPNDSRMKVMYNLTASVRREVGKKVLEAGGNAVLGYRSDFDIEGTSGIVARAYGTACRIIRVSEQSVGQGRTRLVSGDEYQPLDGSSSVTLAMTLAGGRKGSMDGFLGGNVGGGSSNTIGSVVGGGMFASEKREIPPNNSMYAHNVFRLGGPVGDFLGQGVGNEPAAMPLLFQAEVQLCSLLSFDPHVRIRFGGLVMARSVKFLGKLESSLSDQETREGWWEELRDEMKSHARTLYCSHIVGYSESCTIHGEVCMLSAIGTAAVVKQLSYPMHMAGLGLDKVASGDAGDLSKPMSPTGLSDGLGMVDDDDDDEIFSSKPPLSRISSRGGPSAGSGPYPMQNSVSTAFSERENYRGSVTSIKETGTNWYSQPRDRERQVRSLSSYPGAHEGSFYQRDRAHRPCSSAHVPYNHNMAPFAFMRLVPCLVCGRKWVPETMLSTVDPSAILPIRGCGEILEARVCRPRRAATGEADAVRISELLPFVEFDLQRQIMLKLKIMGRNAVFGYTSKIQLGSNLVVATATATAFYNEALPPPPSLHVPQSMKEDSRLMAMQRQVEMRYLSNKNYFESLVQDDPVVDSSGRDGPQTDKEKDREDEYSSSSSSSNDDDDTSSLESPTDSEDSEKEGDESGKLKDLQSASSGAVKGDVEGLVRGMSVDKDKDKVVEKDLATSRRRPGRRLVYKDDRPPFILEVDDETDADILAVLNDKAFPAGISLVNIQYMKGSNDAIEPQGRLVTVQTRVKLRQQSSALSQVVDSLFQGAYARLCFSIRNMVPCQAMGLLHSVNIIEENTLELTLSATVHKCVSKVRPAMLNKDNLGQAGVPPLVSPMFLMFASSGRREREDSFSGSRIGFRVVEQAINRESLRYEDPGLRSHHTSVGSEDGLPLPTRLESASEQQQPALSSSSLRSGSLPVSEHRSQPVRPSGPYAADNGVQVLLTSLFYIPAAKVKRYLGPVQLLFIKESWTSRGEGSLGQFSSVFISEVNACARAHVAALGGNALLCYRLVPQETGGRALRNQIQNMLSVTGDAVLVEYSPTDRLGQRSGFDQHFQRSNSISEKKLIDHDASPVKTDSVLESRRYSNSFIARSISPDI